MLHHEPSGGRTFLPTREDFGRTALIFVTTIALICGAVAAGLPWKAGTEADRELTDHRHQVRATTTERAEDPSGAARHGAQPRFLAPAVWEYPDGVRRSGTIQVPPRTPEGRVMTIWVDGAGSPARVPGSVGERAFAGGAAAAGVVGASGVAVLALAGRRTQARSLAAWEREWEQVEPVWSGRLRRGGGSGAGDG
ncbi:hypothetical protein [Streptomyces sp. NPDC048560]|uniref:Rv1733c family protein n=1 Tax=Streptomyces sp. NPDC048560 TaxID=3155488 RepID=UPI0034446AE1